MTLVIDASALVDALIDTDRKGIWAEAMLDDPRLAAPEFALAETANLLRRGELHGRLTRDEAAAALRHVLRLPIERHPFTPYAERIWQLRHNLTVYDAWYVAIAERLGCPLVTLDVNLYRAPGPACEILIPPWLDQPLQ